ncbi:camp-regulated D2 protein [Plectosphaerella plurivora]|uniref:Camp-regulated D2 protein n=1 Tax=Plectosphaerella plurivora TaxID=936078 RepID=A0A9P8VGH6_9PEZI|nr:camp-regulated D2 protein [Plectosphaerella plurivora]
MRFLMAVAFAAQAVLSGALSVQTQVAGGLSILSKNDLNRKTTSIPNSHMEHADKLAEDAPGAAAILVHESTDYDHAVKHCEKIGESLWVHNSTAFDSGIGSGLARQVYLGSHDDDTLFWVAGNPACGCSAITTSGKIRKVACKKKLPSLCSQSAPLSRAGFEDTSPEFQITQKVGDLQLTGYRDFFTWKFLGVRFAPVPQRFEYSEPLRGASGKAMALKFGADCLQPPNAASPTGGSDDCLFASIWTPYLPSSGKSAKKTALKPVFVFFYGGGFTTGASANNNTDGTNFASRADVVVVAINYRLGNQGMLVFKDGVHNGNVALSDQVSALHWVAENIAAFGGDPKRVTIGGESAGAMSTRYMMTTPLARGLFQQAILRSDGHGGILHGFGHFWSIEKSYETYTLPILKAAGCGDAEDPVDCLRALDGHQLAELKASVPQTPAMWPVVDGTYLTVPQTPLNGTTPGYAKSIPVMSSLMPEEGGVYVGLLPVPDWGAIPLGDLVAGLAIYLGLDASPLLTDPGFFGIDVDNRTAAQVRNATERVMTLDSFICGNQAQMYSASLHGSFETVFASLFNRTYSVKDFTNQWCNATDGNPSQPYWRCHGGDQILYWGNMGRVGMPDRDGLDVPFSQLVIDQTAAFLWTGNPNPDAEYLADRGFDNTFASLKGADEWTPVDPKNPEWLVLRPGDLVMEDWKATEEICLPDVTDEAEAAAMKASRQDGEMASQRREIRHNQRAVQNRRRSDKAKEAKKSEDKKEEKKKEEEERKEPGNLLDPKDLEMGEASRRRTPSRVS